jgi:hypothetical protein
MHGYSPEQLKLAYSDIYGLVVVMHFYIYAGVGLIPF